MAIEHMLEEMMAVVVARIQDQHVLPLLQETQLGKLVNDLRKHPSSRVAARAQGIVAAWKDVIVRQKKDSVINKEQAIQKIEKVKRAPKPAPMPKENMGAAPSMGTTSISMPSSTSNSQLTYEEKLEASKRKLHRAYAQEQAAKRQHTIRVLAPSQLPPMATTSGARAIRAAHGASINSMSKRLGNGRNCAYSARAHTSATRTLVN
ncbi:hypothetical protein GOP47_0026027 [Adiantum capillus-veneris]|uniref:TFIIS N-terminal domain-containing protein n=1 Tax=Adiantum capillus-veneris TaxID=13818 RepID=A0A9D4Z2L3_ADICA|nr:hypothetical protein GOP47_0026027 [Adiantum capillus-veneris]